MTGRNVRWRAAAILLGLQAESAVAKVLTPDAMLGLRSATEVALARDGTAILFTTVRPRREHEGDGPPIAELWRDDGGCEAASEKPVRIGGPGSHDPRFVPGRTSTSSWLAPDAHGNDQVFIAEAGGTPRAVTQSATAISLHKWSADGRQIAYLARSSPVADPHAPVIGGAAENGTALWILSAATGEARRLVERGHVLDFDWAPDGRQLVYAAATSARGDDELLGTRLFAVDLVSGKHRLVAPTTRSPVRSPRWSPDGRWIAWLNGAADNEAFAGIVHVVAAGGGAPRQLTDGRDETPTSLQWMAGEKASLLVRSIRGERTSLFRLSIDGRRRPIDFADDVVVTDGIATSAVRGLIAAVGEAASHPGEVFCAASGGRAVRVTELNPGLGDIALGEQRTINWRSPDGQAIGGVLILPRNRRDGVRYPLVVYVHGGPETAQLAGWYGSFHQWGQMLAGRGIAVLYPNYRGSIGRGVAFLKGEHDDVMGKSFADIVAGVDHLIAQGLIDPARVGIAGYSWGGLGAAWGATYGSARFRAAYVGGGISNWITHSGTSITRDHDQIAHWNRRLHDGNHALFLERSPIAHAASARTPTLILHGARDVDVTVAQAYELDYALRSHGVTVETVIYPDEAHGLQKRSTQRDALQRIERWFTTYLADRGPG